MRLGRVLAFLLLFFLQLLLFPRMLFLQLLRLHVMLLLNLLFFGCVWLLLGQFGVFLLLLLLNPLPLLLLVRVKLILLLLVFPVQLDIRRGLHGRSRRIGKFVRMSRRRRSGPAVLRYRLRCARRLACPAEGTTRCPSFGGGTSS